MTTVRLPGAHWIFDNGREAAFLEADPSGRLPSCPARPDRWSVSGHRFEFQSTEPVMKQAIEQTLPFLAGFHPRNPKTPGFISCKCRPFPMEIATLSCVLTNSKEIDFRGDVEGVGKAS